MKYQNVWMFKLLQPHVEVTKVDGRFRPIVICPREGGYMRTPAWVPVTAVILGAAWMLAAGWGIWNTTLLPEPFRQQIEAVWIGLWTTGA
jgi:hypothetical protein